jgi:LuxR family maltose regulon positive regulatory protein
LEQDARDATLLAARLPEPLSERELEVLRLLASGKSNRRIASELFVSVGTVKTHTNNLYRKLGARSRTQAVARARELDLI